MQGGFDRGIIRGRACSIILSAAWGRAWRDLTTPEIYAEAVRDVKLFLEGRQTDLVKSLRERMAEAAEAQEFERAAQVSRFDFDGGAVAGEAADCFGGGG